jgi:hypothetical protein
MVRDPARAEIGIDVRTSFSAISPNSDINWIANSTVGTSPEEIFCGNNSLVTAFLRALRVSVLKKLFCDFFFTKSGVSEYHAIACIQQHVVQ